MVRILAWARTPSQAAGHFYAHRTTYRKVCTHPLYMLYIINVCTISVTCKSYAYHIPYRRSSYIHRYVYYLRSSWWLFAGPFPTTLKTTMMNGKLATVIKSKFWHQTKNRFTLDDLELNFLSLNVKRFFIWSPWRLMRPLQSRSLPWSQRCCFGQQSEHSTKGTYHKISLIFLFISKIFIIDVRT